MKRQRRRIGFSLALGASLAVAPLAVPPSVWAVDRDRADFASQEEAQRLFDGAGAGGPHGLDGDGDGLVYETLPSGGGGAPRPPRRAQLIDARVTSIVDGDTLRVRAFGARRSRYTVRLLGIIRRSRAGPGGRSSVARARRRRA